MCTRSKKPKSVQRPIKQAYKALHEVGLITSQIQSLLTHCPGATLASLLLFHSLGRLPPQRLSSCSTLIEDSCSRNPHDSFPHFFQFFLSYSLLKEVFPDNPIWNCNHPEHFLWFLPYFIFLNNTNCFPLSIFRHLGFFAYFHLLEYKLYHDKNFWLFYSLPYLQQIEWCLTTIHIG